MITKDEKNLNNDTKFKTCLKAKTLNYRHRMHFYLLMTDCHDILFFYSSAKIHFGMKTWSNFHKYSKLKQDHMIRHLPLKHQSVLMDMIFKNI